MSTQSLIKNEIKNILVNTDLDELSSEKHAFMYYCFKKMEDVDPEEVLEVCSEEFPKLGLGFDGFFVNVDDSTVNFYVVCYAPDAEDGDRINKRELDAAVKKGTKAIEMILEKSLDVLDKASYTYDYLESAYSKSKTHEFILNVYTNLIVPENIRPVELVDFNGSTYAVKVVDFSALQVKSDGDDDLYKINLKERFGFDFNAVKISSTDEFDIYMTAVSGTMLAELYKVDSVRLLESNVRSYLKKTSRVNKGIYATVKDSPNEFAAYNNGLATVATAADIVKVTDSFYKIKTLTNWQIVNGGQTTATLYECSKDKLELEEIIVPCKLTVLKNADDPQTLISNISTYSNTQTAIKKSDPPSNLKYYIDIKRLSDSTWASAAGKNYLCFFERTNGEYNTARRRNNYSVSFKNKYPQKMKFTKLDLAKAIVCWELRPEIANLGSEKNFEYFNNIVKDQLKEVDETYYKNAYSLVLLYRAIDKIIKQKKITTYKSTIVTYTIAMLSKLSNKSFDLETIWNNQDLTNNQKADVEELVDLVHGKLMNAKFGTDIRMWARTTNCWKEIQTIEYELSYSSLANEVLFFAENEPKQWIEDNNNLKNSALWDSLISWDEANNVLKAKEKNMAKGMRYNTSANKPISSAQKDYAISIFMKAVKAGFDYTK